MAFNQAKYDQALKDLVEQVVEEVDEAHQDMDPRSIERLLGDIVHDLSSDIYASAEKIIEDKNG